MLGLGFCSESSVSEWGLVGNEGIHDIGLIFPYSLLIPSKFWVLDFAQRPHLEVSGSFSPQLHICN